MIPHVRFSRTTDYSLLVPSPEGLLRYNLWLRIADKAGDEVAAITFKETDLGCKVKGVGLLCN
jgi:hypothetical protein